MFPSAERKLPSSGAVTATLITAGALCPGNAGPGRLVALSIRGTLLVQRRRGFLRPPLPPKAAFVRPGFLRPGARGTESQIHINGVGERGEEERILILLQLRGQNGC